MKSPSPFFSGFFSGCGAVAVGRTGACVAGCLPGAGSGTSSTGSALSSPAARRMGSTTGWKPLASTRRRQSVSAGTCTRKFMPPAAAGLACGSGAPHSRYTRVPSALVVTVTRPRLRGAGGTTAGAATGGAVTVAVAAGGAWGLRVSAKIASPVTAKPAPAAMPSHNRFRGAVTGISGTVFAPSASAIGSAPILRHSGPCAPTWSRALTSRSRTALMSGGLPSGSLCSSISITRRWSRTR